MALARARSAGWFALPLLACACASGNEGGSTAVPPHAPSHAIATTFTANDIDGKPVRLSDYLGKKAILLNFFATWCKPCVAEFPHLRTLYDTNEARGFVVIAVSVDGPETAANVANFAKRNTLPFATLVDADSHITSIYNPSRSVPLSVLIDKAGNIVRVREGYVPGDENLMIEDVANVLDPP